MTTPKPPTLSSDIQSLLAEFDASGQSVAAFARAQYASGQTMARKPAP